MRHIRNCFIFTLLLTLPVLNWAEDYESDNNFNPWKKIDQEVISTSLEVISNDPKAYLGQRVRFTCRYHQAESKFSSVSTGISETQFSGFSVWGMKTVLFKEQSFARDNPFMYVEKIGRAMTDLGNIRKFQVIEVTGVVRSAYLERPWIVVEKLGTKFFAVHLKQKSLSQARLGLSLIEQGKYMAAAKELEATLEQDFDSYMEAQVSKYCGYAYLKAGEPGKAVDFLEEAYAKIKDADTGGWWGEALVAAGQYGNAISALETVVEEFPTHLGLRLALAEAYSEESSVSECMRHGRAALNLEIGNKAAYTFMATALVSKGRDAEALKIYREAEKEAKGDRGSFNWAMGQILYRQEKYQNSFHEFEIAKRSYPDNEILCLDTARSYREAGRKFHVKSARNFNRAFEINATLVGPRLELGTMHYMDKEYEACIIALEDYLSLQKDHVPALIMKGVAHEKLGHFKTAARIFLDLERLDGTGYASQHLGFSLWALKQHAAAAEAYNRAALAITEKDYTYDAAFRSGALFLFKGEISKAKPMVELAYTLKDDDVFTAINVVKVTERLGDHTRAYEVSNKFVTGTNLTYRQQIILQQHWSYNALALGHTPDKLAGLEATVEKVFWARPKHEQVITSYGWVKALKGDAACLGILKPLIDKRLDARVAMLHYFLGLELLDDAKTISAIATPKAGSSATILKTYSVLREILKNELEARRLRRAKAAEEARLKRLKEEQEELERIKQANEAAEEANQKRLRENEKEK
jgi:tetratricopeptide (TPR) repeat protein